MTPHITSFMFIQDVPALLYDVPWALMQIGVKNGIKEAKNYGGQFACL